VRAPTPVDGFAKTAKAVFPYLLVAGLIALRNPAAVFRAEFWAEDGTEFFRTALGQGVSSLWIPVFGYQFFLSRAIAWAATLVPVVATPSIYAGACLVLNAVSVGYFSREGFAWLIPARSRRLFVCGLLAVAPGSGEVFLSLCNLTNSLALLALLMLIEKPHRLSWRKFAALMLIGISSGHTVILLPLILFLVFRTRDRRYVYLIMGIIPIQLANAIGNHHSGVETGFLDYSKLLVAPHVVMKNFVARLFFAPFLGVHETNILLRKAHALFWVAGAAALAGLLWAVRRTRSDREAAEFLGLSYVLTVGTFGIIVVSRAYVADLVQKNILWDIRYSFLPGVLADLIWMSLFLGWWRDRRARRSLAAVGLVGIVLVAGNNLSRWRHVPGRPDAHWPESARSIQVLLDQRARGELVVAGEVSGIRMHPVGTKFEWLTVTIPPSEPPRSH
jgi:hypothetical protein